MGCAASVHAPTAFKLPPPGPLPRHLLEAAEHDGVADVPAVETALRVLYASSHGSLGGLAAALGVKPGNPYLRVAWGLDADPEADTAALAVKSFEEFWAVAIKVCSPGAVTPDEAAFGVYYNDHARAQQAGGRLRRSVLLERVLATAAHMDEGGRLKLSAAASEVSAKDVTPAHSLATFSVLAGLYPGLLEPVRCVRERFLELAGGRAAWLGDFGSPHAASRRARETVPDGMLSWRAAPVRRPARKAPRLRRSASMSHQHRTRARGQHIREIHVRPPP